MSLFYKIGCICVDLNIDRLVNCVTRALGDSLVPYLAETPIATAIRSVIKITSTSFLQQCVYDFNPFKNLCKAAENLSFVRPSRGASYARKILSLSPEVTAYIISQVKEAVLNWIIMKPVTGSKRTSCIHHQQAARTNKEWAMGKHVWCSSPCKEGGKGIVLRTMAVEKKLYFLSMTVLIPLNIGQPSPSRWNSFFKKPHCF